MHLGNSIICPVTGIPMLFLAGISIYYAVKKAKQEKKRGSQHSFQAKRRRDSFARPKKE